MIRKIFLFVVLMVAMCSLAIGQQALVVTTTGSSIMLSYQKMDRIIRSSSGQAVIVYDGNTASYTTQGTYASFVTSSGCNIVSFTEAGTSRLMAVPISNISHIVQNPSGRALVHVQDRLSGRVIRYEATNTFSSISSYITECSDLSGDNGGDVLSGTGSPVGAVTPAFIGEHYFDITTPGSEVIWLSVGSGNTNWIQLN